MAGIEKFQVVDPDSGRVIVRAGVLLALFSVRSVHEQTESILALLEHYLACIPAGSLQWAITSATVEQWRPLDSTALQRCKAGLTKEGAAKRRLTAFHLSDHGAGAPEYAFELVGKPRGDDFPDAATLVQMSFPMGQVSGDRVDDFAAQVLEFGRLFNFTSGYCSPSFLFSPLHVEDAFAAMRGPALRHPGFDVHCNDRSRLRIGRRIRGARWITFLEREALDAIGDFEILQNLLPSTVVVAELPSGVAIRAGRVPEIGDSNRRLNTPLLRAVASPLEPITWFGEPHMLSYFADFDDSLLERWERRLLD